MLPRFLAHHQRSIPKMLKRFNLWCFCPYCIRICIYLIFRMQYLLLFGRQPLSSRLPYLNFVLYLGRFVRLVERELHTIRDQAIPDNLRWTLWFSAAGLFSQKRSIHTSMAGLFMKIWTRFLLSEQRNVCRRKIDAKKKKYMYRRAIKNIQVGAPPLGNRLFLTVFLIKINKQIWKK